MAAAGDDAEKGTSQRSSMVSCFGACFVYGKMKNWEESAGSLSRKKKKGGLLSWWRLIRRSKTMFRWKSQKTVPVDAAVDEVEEMEEVKWVEGVLVSGEKEKKGGEEGGPAVEHGGGERARKAKSKRAKPPHEPQKATDGPSTSKYATCSHSASFNPRKPFAQPAPPARSISFPAPGRRRLQRGPSSRKFEDLDPVVRMSILIVALAVLLWGRVCAVFCTSAWVYFVSRLRKEARSGTRPGLGGQNTNSIEYKKKVVMEGLLERSRRNQAETL